MRTNTEITEEYIVHLEKLIRIPPQLHTYQLRIMTELLLDIRDQLAESNKVEVRGEESK